MNEFKTKLEIETLKALTYTQINELLNKLTLENKKLKEQLILSGVVKSSTCACVEPSKYITEDGVLICTVCENNI